MECWTENRNIKSQQVRTEWGVEGRGERERERERESSRLTE